MIARLVRTKRRQVILSTHASELLADPGIQPSEVLLFRPSEEGTQVDPASDLKDVPKLLEAGMTMADIAKEQTKPVNADQLALFDEIKR